MDKESGGYAGGEDGGYGGAGGETWPKDMFGCRNGAIPGFLTKTFKIVSDPNTDSIISWSLSGNSFIIWDHNKFSAEVLPRFFRHNNLSSFVYQLNSYCFRKIGVAHQWEYQNPNFQAGKEHLLANINKRGKNQEIIIKRNPNYRTMHNNAVEIKTKILRNEINETKLEIGKLKTRQSDMEFHIMAFESKMKIFESKSKKLMMYLAKACDNVFKITKDYYKTRNVEKEEDEARKKRKMDKNEKNGIFNSGFENLDGKKCDQDQEKTVVIDLVSEVGLDDNLADSMYWKKILQDDDDDDEVCEINEAGTEIANKEAKIVMDLEGLIAKLPGQEGERVNATL